PVVGPRLGQEQLEVDEALVAAPGHGEVDGDDAVVDLAGAAEVLALHAGGLVALLEAAGLVDDADGAGALGVCGAGELLAGVFAEAVADQAEVPGVVLEE